MLLSLQPGEGFQVIPEITIQSATGQKAQLLAKLWIDRVRDISLVDQEKVIQVVDCGRYVLMSAKINYEAYRLGTKDGEIKFGHLSTNQQIYSVYLNNYMTDAPHYIAMVQTG